MKVPAFARALLAYFQPLLLFSSSLNDAQSPLSHYNDTIFASAVKSYPVDLAYLFDNIAVGPHANFDPRGERWDAKLMPTSSLDVNGITYQLPQKWDGKPDNVVSDRQTVKIPHFVEFPREMHVLYAGDFIDGETGATFTFHFEDGSEQQVEASIHNWWNLHWINSGAAVKMPYHLRADGSRNYNQTQIFSWSTSISTTSRLKSITLPGTNDWNRLHIFAMTLVPSHTAGGIALSFRQVRFTTRWRIIENVKAFAVEVTMASLLPSALAPDPRYWINSPWLVWVGSPGVETIQLGEYWRAMPGDQLILDVWVAPKQRSIDDMDTYQILRESLLDSSVVVGAQEVGTNQMLSQQVTVDVESDPLLRDIPEWFGDAKFGIFMHWGVFAIPGWAPPGPYAEWYWWWQHTPMDSSNYFWNYHRETYGADFVYDDFIPELGGKFDADTIMDIVASSGARYFVPTTMHHDGFAIFDTGNATHRSSVYLGPKRDFLMEMFESAKARHPSLVMGTYFSMPEWFNPDSGAGGYGFGNWPGNLAVNAYDNSQVEPYTGRLPGRDWLREQQLVKMKILAEKYKTNVMWCDIGGPNLTRTFLEDWLPFADKNGIQFAMNNRCGALPQFDTPEYAKFSSIQTQKWESSESVDPYSYGYNRYTKDEDYRSPQYLITSLVDIVSKNGNYLLNIGPDGDGVVPRPVVQRLKAVGEWLAHSGDCIFDTDYFFFGAEYRSLRFTRTSDTFCIIAIERPKNRLLVIDTPVPVLPHDTIALLGAGSEGANLTWSQHQNGPLVIDVPDSLLDKIDHAWAFQVTYKILPA
ncbi:glycoside hydrolase [Clavulina sp. PMI_390]|nr:glycoside hydrolase [Clavulina sp. PMI_390]